MRYIHCFVSVFIQIRYKLNTVFGMQYNPAAVIGNPIYILTNMFILFYIMRIFVMKYPYDLSTQKLMQ